MATIDVRSQVGGFRISLPDPAQLADAPSTEPIQVVESGNTLGLPKIDVLRLLKPQVRVNIRGVDIIKQAPKGAPSFVPPLWLLPVALIGFGVLLGRLTCR